MDFVDVASKLGVPVAVMVAMGLFFLSVARWFRPRVDQIIDSHLSLISNLKENSDKNTKNLNDLAERAVCQFDPQAHCANYRPKEDK